MSDEVKVSETEAKEAKIRVIAAQNGCNPVIEVKVNARNSKNGRIMGVKRVRK